ncbi:hypothetical protein ACSS6W_007033 [Trichoderma asperelloides]
MGLKRRKLHGGIFLLHSAYIAVSGWLSPADWLVDKLERLSRDFEPPAMYIQGTGETGHACSNLMILLLRLRSTDWRLIDY